jgi:hypothetical protein
VKRASLRTLSGKRPWRRESCPEGELGGWTRRTSRYPEASRWIPCRLGPTMAGAEAEAGEAAGPSPTGQEVEPEVDMAHGERVEYEAEEAAVVVAVVVAEAMPAKPEAGEEEEEEAKSQT